MKKLIFILFVLLFSNSFGQNFFWSHSGTFPNVTTTSITNITGTTASSGGNVTSDGGLPVTARGVCWNTSSDPTIANNHTSDGTGTGVFISSITGLSSSTVYHVRSYATNSVGTNYGSDISFTSANTNLPSISELTFSLMSRTFAYITTTIYKNGGGDISEIGICYSISNTNPTTADSKTIGSNTEGSQTITVSGLSPGTTYYWRAYAINGNGTAYYPSTGFSYATLP